MRPYKGRILFTGMNGVGKTTLFDYMTAKAYSKDYRPPDKSHHRETGVMT